MKARDNPFSADRVLRIRYCPLGITWPELLERLKALEYRAAVVGPHGSGKTTLLEDLEPHLRALGFTPARLRLTEEENSFPPDALRRFITELNMRDVVLFDGADLMRPRSWARLKRKTSRAGGLIITSHRPGLLPTLIECRTTPQLLGYIAAQLAGADALPSDLIFHLFDKHNGNLREALRHLYDLWAQRRSCAQNVSKVIKDYHLPA